MFTKRIIELIDTEGFQGAIARAKVELISSVEYTPDVICYDHTVPNNMLVEIMNGRN